MHNGFAWHHSRRQSIRSKNIDVSIYRWRNECKALVRRWKQINSQSLQYYCAISEWINDKRSICWQKREDWEGMKGRRTLRLWWPNARDTEKPSIEWTSESNLLMKSNQKMQNLWLWAGAACGTRICLKMQLTFSLHLKIHAHQRRGVKENGQEKSTADVTHAARIEIIINF